MDIPFDLILQFTGSLDIRSIFRNIPENLDHFNILSISDDFSEYEITDPASDSQ